MFAFPVYLQFVWQFPVLLTLSSFSLHWMAWQHPAFWDPSAWDHDWRVDADALAGAGWTPSINCWTGAISAAGYSACHHLQQSWVSLFGAGTVLLPFLGRALNSFLGTCWGCPARIYSVSGEYPLSLSSSSL